MAQTLSDLLAENVRNVQANKYPGRFLTDGRMTDTRCFQLALRTARSPESKNMAFIDLGNGKVQNDIADPDGPKGDPVTTLYNPMMETDAQTGRLYVVSNGKQTNLVCRYATCSENGLYGALHNPELADIEERCFEPDSLCTPRITATLGLFFNGKVTAETHQISALRKSQLNGSTVRMLEELGDIPTGVGYAIHTYDAYEDPYRADVYRGPAYLLPVVGDSLREVVRGFREMFDPELFVSVAGKAIDLKSGNSEVYIENRFEYVTR